MENKKHIKSFNEATENLNIFDVSDSDDIQQMSLEEKLLRMKLKMYDETLSLSQMECVIDAMKEVSLQRKLGNWTDNIK